MDYEVEAILMASVGLGVSFSLRCVFCPRSAVRLFDHWRVETRE